MRSVGAFDAKTHLNELLEQVSHGESIQITRRGVPVARLVPPEIAPRKNPREIARELRALRLFADRADATSTPPAGN